MTTTAAKRAAGVKRAEEWTNDEVATELRKYTRAEAADADEVVDPLIALVADERQRTLVQFLAEAGATMDRYEARRAGAAAQLRGFRTGNAGIAALQAPRGRVIHLPVDFVDAEGNIIDRAAAAADGGVDPAASVRPRDGAKGVAGGDGTSGSPRTATTAPVSVTFAGQEPAGNDDGDDDDSDTDSTTSSSSSSTPVEPSADHPEVAFLPNAELLTALETLQVEALAFERVCVRAMEYLALTAETLDKEDQEVMDIQGRLVEAFGQARDVATDRYEFHGTYLDVRSKLESSQRNWPDVQALRELMAARDESAWEEVVRSWGLLRSTLATLSAVVAANIRYVVAPDVAVHHAAESGLFM